MDDSASVDLIDVSPIGNPDHFRITVKQLWRAEQPHSDAENEGTGNVANDSPIHRRGSPQRLPPSRGSRRLKRLTLDTGTPSPSSSPGYPSPAESPPSPSLYSPDYFDVRTENLLRPTKVEDDMWLRRSPSLLIHVRVRDLSDEFNRQLTPSIANRILTISARRMHGISTPAIPHSRTQTTTLIRRSRQKSPQTT